MEIEKKMVNSIASCCPICLRKSFENEDNVFFGCVKSKECVQCKRFVCELHFHNRENRCCDCFVFVNPKFKR